MKIIRVCTLLDFGGLEQRFVNISYIKDENEWVFCALGPGGEASKIISKNGKRVVLLNGSYAIPSFTAIIKLVNFFKLEKPDVVHTSGAEANFHGIIAAKLAKIPICISEEIGISNHGTFWKVIFKFIYGLSDNLVGISEAVVDNVVRLGEVKREKTTVIYNPVKLTITDGLRINKDQKEFIFITTCRLVPIKNLEVLLKAFSQLVTSSESKIILQILGSGPELQNLTKLANSLDMTQSVKFLGFMRNVYPYLKNADAFVLPSLSEGFSISLVEAMLVGLPCIVTEVGGPGEIVNHNESGFLVDPHEELQLIDAMRKIINMSNKERLLMGEQGKKDAQKFSLNNHIENLLRLYNSIHFQKKN